MHTYKLTFTVTIEEQDDPAARKHTKGIIEVLGEVGIRIGPREGAAGERSTSYYGSEGREFEYSVARHINKGLSTF